MSVDNLIGGRPVEGDGPRVRMVGNDLGELAGRARFARQQLAALQRGELRACWVGVAADAFAAELEILPADLGKLELSLDKASTAVRRWAATIDRLQPEGDRLHRSHFPAFTHNANVQAELVAQRLAIGDRIEDALTGADRIAPYERRADDAEAELRRIDNQLRNVREEADAIARSVSNMLDEASRLGIQNDTWLEQIGQFFEDLRDALIEVLAFLDELLELIGPFLDIAVLIIGLFNPALGAALGLALAIIDFGLTASRAMLGDERVEFSDLMDDAVGLAFAAVGARQAFRAAKAAKALKAAKATKSARQIRNAEKAVKAARGGKIIQGVDATGKVVGGADITLGLTDMAFDVGPGGTVDAIFDVAEGNTGDWEPGADGSYADDFNDAYDDLVSPDDNGANMEMPDFEFSTPETTEPPVIIDPPPGGGEGITPPGGGGEGGGGITPPPPGGGEGGGITPPAPVGGGEGGGITPPPPGGGESGGITVPVGDFAGNSSGTFDGLTPGGDFAPPSVAEPVGSIDSTPGDISTPATGIPSTGDMPAAPIGTADPVIATTTGAATTGTGNTVAAAAAAGAAAVGLTSAAIGAKRIIDRENDDEEAEVQDTVDPSAVTTLTFGDDEGSDTKGEQQ